MKYLFYNITTIFLTFYGCGLGESRKRTDPGMQIRLLADSTGVVLYNIPLQVTEEFKADSIKGEQWKDFFAVYEEPADPEMRDFQQAVDGSYTVKDASIEFIPAKDFEKGKSYFSRCYTRELMQEPEDIISTRDLSPTDSFLEYKFNIK
ncbi:MAG: hypothetical protein ACYCZO_08125 [Daejeonella sp.]